MSSLKNLRLRYKIFGLSAVLAMGTFGLFLACGTDSTGNVPAIAAPETAPLSGMAAIRLEDAGETGATNIPDYVKALVDAYARDDLPEGVEFPLPNDFPISSAGVAGDEDGDNVHVADGLAYNVVAKWFDPLRHDNTADAPVYGANNDYIAYFGKGWNSDWSGDADPVVRSAPQFNGSPDEGWVWTNHEYVSDKSAATDQPQVGAAPVAGSQFLTLAQWMEAAGILDFDVTSNANWDQPAVNAYIDEFKRHVGGSWFKVKRDPLTGEYKLVQDEKAQRYDATSNTLLRVTGFALNALDHDDAGTNLPAGVVAGIAGDCSGGQTPWGTIISAEENVQDYYGDLEATWNNSNWSFVTGQGFDTGEGISPPFASDTSINARFGRSTDVNARHERDTMGFLAEIDPGVDPANYYDTADGVGHRKLGVLGRSRWENAAIVVDARWRLIPGQKMVVYAGDDRRNGRIFKWVSADPYTAGMTRKEIRALLDTGTLFVAHFEDLDNDTGITIDGGDTPTESERGTGRWIELSTTSTDTPPNQTTAPGGTGSQNVGQALQDNDYNGIGAFVDDNDILSALFTASAKIGVRELNRPEDVEWNPIDQRLYIAFTNHTGNTALNGDGVVTATIDSSTPPCENVDDERCDRDEADGVMFLLEEENSANPAGSGQFTFWQVWDGVQGTGDFDATCIDNIMIDREGGVWFGTDGNYGRTNSIGDGSGRGDALYYLDLNPAHKNGEDGIVNASYGKGFRIAVGPSDSEATGPAFNSDMSAIFFNVQHPGESILSNWPQPPLVER
ncbi:MAG: alkaline phosphatase PhoX [Bdellovibrionota bacterium]